jgi:hypothetical protein
MSPCARLRSPVHARWGESTARREGKGSWSAQVGPPVPRLPADPEGLFSDGEGRLAGKKWLSQLIYVRVTNTENFSFVLLGYTMGAF